jgi:hypothetical protein
MKKKEMTGKSSTPPKKKPNPSFIPPPNQSQIEETSDLLDNIPVDASVELTRRSSQRYPPFLSGQSTCALS